MQTTWPPAQIIDDSDSVLRLSGQWRHESNLQPAHAGTRDCWLLGNGSGFVRVNPAMARLMGYDSADEMVQSITDVALAVGFSDSGYFSRVFRREVGLSPEAFRREKS